MSGSTSRTSARAREVSRSAGPVVGIAAKTTVLPSAEVCGSLTEAMRGTERISSASPGTSLALGSSLVVFEASPHKQAAWQLIEYLALPEVQQRFYELTGDLPPRRESWQGPPLAADREADAFRRQLEQVEPAPQVPEWERIASEMAHVAERAARGLDSVEAAQHELDVKTNRILEKRRWLLERGALP